jgi:hypothetical protein
VIAAVASVAVGHAALDAAIANYPEQQRRKRISFLAPRSKNPIPVINAALRSSLVIHGLKDEFDLLARQQLELGTVHQRLLVFRIGAEHSHLEGPLARRSAIKTTG